MTQLALKSTPSMGLAKVPAKTGDPQALRLAIAERLGQLQADQQVSSPACSVVMARAAGTPITTASEERIEAMWTQIIKLLEIKHKTDEEADLFDKTLIDLNDWVQREYGHQGLTCEELELAYNALVKVELSHDDGRILQSYPSLDTKHLGEVLAAYRRLVNGMSEVNEVIRNGLHLPQPAGPSTEQIDAYMEKSLTNAISEVRAGHYYIDHGNALYTWLYKQNRFRPTQEQWKAAATQAEKVIKEDLIEQKRLVGGMERRAANQSVTDHLTPLRSRIGKQLAAVVRREGDFPQRIRSEAYQRLLLDYLRTQVEVLFGEVLQPIERPREPEPDVPKPFSHRHYIEQLTEQLPTMNDEKLSNLQRQARLQNWLDVYELTTAEWNYRQAKKQANQSTAKKKAAWRFQ